MNVTSEFNATDKTLAVTYRGETRIFPAFVLERDGTIERVIAYRVFAAKFRSGNKLWPCHVTLWMKTGNTTVDQGGFSNKGGARAIVGWFNPESQNNSQHSGQR